MALAAKLRTKKAEKGDLVAKLNELQEKVAYRNGELDKIGETLIGMSQDFHALVEGHAQTDALTKVFDKQVKRKALKYVKRGEKKEGEEKEERRRSGRDRRGGKSFLFILI